MVPPPGLIAHAWVVSAFSVELLEHGRPQPVQGRSSGLDQQLDRVKLQLLTDGP
jgi:hypothetical protein